MRWYTVSESWESVKGESSSLGGCKGTNFFLFFFPSDVLFISFSFPHEANTCFPFIIMYYFARYPCIACIMLLKPHSRVIRRSVSPRFIKLCTETLCLYLLEGHKHGGRTITEKSVIETKRFWSKNCSASKN